MICYIKAIRILIIYTNNKSLKQSILNIKT